MADIQPLLYSREVACKLLGVSIFTLVKLEQAGRLAPVRLNPTVSKDGVAQGSVHYTAEDIKALIEASRESKVGVKLKRSPSLSRLAAARQSRAKPDEDAGAG